MPVREEAVRLSLKDDFTTPMAKVTAATLAQAKALDLLDGKSIDLSTSARSVSSDLDGVDRSSRSAAQGIDSFSGRVSILGQALTLLSPAGIAIGAVAVPAVVGLATQLGTAAGAAGTAVLAFQGVGDALTAVNKAGIEPTAENIAEARRQLEALSPAASQFVLALRDMEPAFTGLRDSAAEGLFPGLTQSLDNVEALLPKLGDIAHEVGSTLGSLAAEGTASLAGPRWEAFFDYLENSARPTLVAMGHAVGDLAHGFAEVVVAFGPLSSDFGTMLANAASGFDDWATGLADSSGFESFVDYIREAGPQLADAVGSIVNAVVQIAEAGAPLTGPLLDGITAFANAVSAIADSSLGTPLFTLAAALSAVSLASRGFDAALSTGLGRGLTTAKANTTGLIDSLNATKTAQLELVAAQAQARTAQTTYIGQLRAQNTLQAQGYTTSTAAQSRLADSLGRVEVANYGVATATEKVNAARATQAAGIRDIAGQAGRAIGLMGGLALATSGLADSAGLSNTAIYGMTGAFAGPWAAAAGAAVGLTLDLSQANDDLEASAKAAIAAYNSGDMDAASRAVQQLGEQTKGWRENVIGADGVAGGIQAIGYSIAHLPAGIDNLFGDHEITDAVDQFRELRANIRLTREEARWGGGVSLAEGLFGPLGGMNEEIYQATLGVKGLSDALAGLSGWLDRREALRGYDEALANLTAGIKDGFTSQDAANIDSVGRSIIQVASAIKNKGDRAEFLSGTIKSLNQLSNQAGPRAEKAIDTLISRLRRYGVTSPKSPKLDVDTDGADVKISRLRDGFKSLPKKARMLLQLTGADKSREDMKRFADQFAKTPQQKKILMTLQAQAARTGIGDIGDLLKKLDQEKTEPKVDVETSAAISGIQRVQQAIDNLPSSHSITITTNYRTTGHPPKGDRGLYLPTDPIAFARGGDIADAHEPEFAGPGLTRIWREPETGGESYIPHANDSRRPRAKQILEQTADLFGGDVQWYAGGGIRTEMRRPASPVTAGGTVVHRIVVTGELDAAKAMATIEQRIESRSDDVYWANREWETR